MTRDQKKRLEKLEARRPRALPAEDPAEIHRKACERLGVPYRPLEPGFDYSLDSIVERCRRIANNRADRSVRDTEVGVGASTE
jgi:hypothetical protein